MHIIITGGDSGIGQARAVALQAKDNKVTITGRRQAALDETTQANLRMETMAPDVTDPAAIRACASEVIRRCPTLNVVINNAGIVKPENVVNNVADLIVAQEVCVQQIGFLRYAESKSAFDTTFAMLSGILHRKRANKPTIDPGYLEGDGDDQRRPSGPQPAGSRGRRDRRCGVAGEHGGRAPRRRRRGPPDQWRGP